MIDYDATLQSFFAECVKFLENRKPCAQDKVELGKINIAIDTVRRVATNPVKYSDYNTRVKEGLEKFEVADGFCIKSSGVFRIYANVLHHMGELNSTFDYRRTLAQQTLLNSLKSMRYHNNKNMFKDFYFPFMSPTKFAVKVRQNQR